LVEVAKTEMSEAELKKLEELKRLKKEKKAAKKAALEEEKVATTALKGDALPEIQLHRKGQFEMIPDFLKQKEVLHDLTALGVADMMSNAIKKQEDENAN
jgi:hypothetical protein